MDFWGTCEGAFFGEVLDQGLNWGDLHVGIGCDLLEYSDGLEDVSVRCTYIDKSSCTLPSLLAHELKVSGWTRFL